MRRRRRRWLREDVLAPWLTMGAILAIWWVGARAIADDASDAPSASTSIFGRAPERSPSRPAAARAAADANHASRPSADRAVDDSTIVADPASTARELSELLERDLLLPVAGVDPTTLRSSFVEARGGGSRTHEAIDILAPRGTSVYATLDGRIARLFTSAAGGLTIYQFDPSEQYCFYYAHLDGYAPDLAEGQMVRRGQTIGYVGTTGNAPASTPHLHFAIYKLGADKRWWEGEPLDPYLVLRKDG